MSAKSTALVIDGVEKHVEQIKTIIEEVMMELDPEKSQEEHRQYLAGFIDALAETKCINEQIREELYTIYVS